MDHFTKETNNFNLIRLLACLQVMVFHSYSLKGLANNQLFIKLIWLFPGVIIFFSLSGFLIIRSLETSSQKIYLQKRFFRIFPGLFLNVIITFILLISLKYIVFNFDAIKYFLSQLTAFQFYVPDSYKAFGIGHHPNGALGTISVEIQFYVFLLMLTKITSWNKKSNLFKNEIVCIFISISCLINYLSNHYLNPNSLLFKLLYNSVIYHFTFFGIGILFWINFYKIRILLMDKAKYWLVLLLISIYLIIYKNLEIARYQFDFLSFLYLLLLIVSLFSFAFSYKGLSHKILGNIDISYGTYIYHCLIINLFILLKISDNYIPSIWVISIILGYLSWILIEKKFLIKKPI